MEQHFGRSIDELGPIVGFLEKAAAQFALDQGTTFVLNMVVEELYTNMVKYNGAGADDILVGVDVRDHTLFIELIDFDSQPFDLDEREEVDIHAPLEERRPGGLGIHLVKRFMDEVNYQYKDRKTTIKLVKHLNSNA